MTGATCDVLVVGSGAGGLSAAVTAAQLGLQVILAEKEPWIGGTTAVSGGWLWIPGNPLAERAGIADPPETVRTYLKHELGNRYDERRIEAFLANGPRMVSFFERETAVRFILGNSYPDYHQESPGASPGGRAVCAAPLDGRLLGDHLGEIRPPVRELTLFGIKVGSGPDFRHFANAKRSLPSALYVARRIARHFVDRLVHGRDVQLMSGNALIGALLKAAYDGGVTVWRASPALELLRDGGRVIGASVLRDGAAVQVTARCGVVLAAGGFSRDPVRRQRLFTHLGPGETHYSLAGPGNTGDGARMAEAVGASVEEGLASPAAWMPVSPVPYPDGSEGIYPHSFDRGKPGVIAVGPDGRRFVNESNSYHDMGMALLGRAAAGEPTATFFICDHRFIREYGLGIAKPAPIPLFPYLRSGYLKRGRSLADLATALGIDADGLKDTVQRFNAAAREGADPAFRRGSTVYNAYNGDPVHAPNPCLAPIETAPFYGVRVYPGDIGTFAGLRTDADAAVLDRDGAPIPGLYAVGTDMASLFGGVYPGPGINLGPAMTFGFVAAHHMAGRAPF